MDSGYWKQLKITRPPVEGAYKCSQKDKMGHINLRPLSQDSHKFSTLTSRTDLLLDSVGPLGLWPASHQVEEEGEEHPSSHL